MSSDILVFAFGSYRLDRITPALDGLGEVVSHHEVIEGNRWASYPGIRKLIGFGIMNGVLSRDDTVAIVDGFNVYSVVILLLCRVHGSDFMIRVRGGMWNEKLDYLRYGNSILRTLTNAKFELIRNTLLKRADRILVVSYFTRTQIVYELDVDPAKIEVVYEPIDPARFEEVPADAFRAQYSFAPDDPILLCVTNFDYWNKAMGIRYFLPGIQRVLDENPSWQFVVAGDGKFWDELRAGVRESVPEEVFDRISFIGYHEAIEEAFVAAEIVLHLSFRDTVGYTVLEAQAAGKPVVVNPDGGMPEVLPPSLDQHQVVMEPGDLAKTVSELINDEELRRTIGDENRAHIEAKFSIQNTRKKLDEVFSR